MQLPVVTHPLRKLSKKFMFGEAAWILSGSQLVRDIAPYNNKIQSFSDNEYSFQGAYGPKVVEQLNYVCDILSEDFTTRQAVINIWRESPRKSKDTPCTLSMQFLVRDNLLHMVVSMRSSDLWLGWPYDVFNFSCIASMILILLQGTWNIRPQLGNLYLTAGSQHIYHTEWEKAILVLRDNSPTESYRPLDPYEFTTEEAFVNFLHTCADGLRDSTRWQYKSLK